MIRLIILILIINLAFICTDIYTTTTLLNKGYSEGNPLALDLMNNYGVLGWSIILLGINLVASVVIVLLNYILSRRLSEYVWICFLTMSIILLYYSVPSVINNLAIMM